MKICSKCKIRKSFKYFYRQKSSKDGRGSYCILCSKNSSKNRYWKNPEKYRNDTKKYIENNKEKYLKYNIEYRKNNSEYFLKKKRQYQKDRQELISAMRHRHYEKHTDKIKNRVKNYKKNNPHKVSALCAKRRASLIQATPKWADLQKIETYYKISQILGDKHVDHFIPLKGKNVCGLHVHYNLQVIPIKENLKKHNKVA